MTINPAHAEAFVASSASEREWADLVTETPMLVGTMRRYLSQLGTFLAPRSVDVADITLRQFARWLIASSDVTDVAAISRTTSRTTKFGSPASPVHTAPPWPRTPSGTVCG